ncbi:hypothetical protein CVT25_002114 [Psilocybe cyanescens]|uniref:FHA domain-containing protein n=1 Tax=Psilocybe cyanescens TaxID=93625 RepID=A0A409XC40_PSICY|nr:hypothetical protein CVT25_002114 [Psilocybe cyanescens]
MLDDEIVFLGSTNGLHASNSIQSAQRPVTGVTLHIEKQGANDAGYRMLFRKANTSVVHIGRRSGLEADTSLTRSQDHEQGNAMFRCAVVSRKHAKIAFSDSGHAYLIDLGSHHGTHIRKPGEKFSKMVKPETSTLLVDGDIVTFGKSVGKGDEMVRPIVARIELLHAGHNMSMNNPSSTPFKPLVVPSTTSPSLSNRSISKSVASGRYGVHTSSSSSSDESYSSYSGIYSDIEEIPPPATSFNPSASLNDNNVEKSIAVENSTSENDKNNSKDDGNAASPGSLGQALNVLKRFLPPSQPSSTPRLLPSVTEIVERPFAHMSSFLFGPDSAPISPKCNSPDSMLPVKLPQLDSRPEPSDSHDNNHFSPPPPMRPLSDSSVIGFDASQHDIYEADIRSRSNSPMDLASPSPALQVIVGRSLSIPPPPSTSEIYSPTRHSPPLSPPHTLAPLAASSSDDGSTSTPSQAHGAPGLQSMDVSLVVSPDENGSGRFCNQSYRSPFADGLDHYPMPNPDGFNVTAYYEYDHRRPQLSPVTPLRVRQIEDTVESLKVDVTKLHSHRRKYKARFNSNVQVISEKLGEFDDRLLEVNAEYNVMANQVERIQEMDIAELNSHLEMIQDSVDEIAEERDEDVEERKRDKEDVESSLTELGAAIAELKAFRDETKNQIDEEISSIKALHEATVARMTAQDTQYQQTKELLLQCQEIQARLEAQANTEVGASQTPVLTSLKRKRDDTDENEDVDESEKCERENMVVDCEMNAVGHAPASTAGSSSRYVIDDNASSAEGEGIVELSGPLAKAYVGDAPPPRKRARRFVKVAAQTATAVTVGAVITWSALAFS